MKKLFMILPLGFDFLLYGRLSGQGSDDRA